ncbi:MAG: hypothetical protein AB7T49_03705 [Oligoflexales bacterium]
MNKVQVLKSVRKMIESNGLLLQVDGVFPSVAGIVAGRPIKGSWWSDPNAQGIFYVCGEVAEAPDIVVTRVVEGKVTFVHEKLWPALLAVGTSKEKWQIQKMAKRRKALLAEVESLGEFRVDDPTPEIEKLDLKLTDAIRDFERRLLVVTEQIHTESGAHTKIVRSWRHWSQEKGIVATLPSVSVAKEQLVDAAASLMKGKRPRLLWEI